MNNILPLTHSPQVDLAEALYIKNLEGSAFASLPSDLRIKLCLELFVGGMKGLSALLRTCRAMNTICKREFLTACEARIVEYVRSLSSADKQVAIWWAFGGGMPTPKIMELVEKLEFNDSLPSQLLPTRLPPRLFCTELSVVLQGNKMLLSQIISRCPPFLQKLTIKSPHTTDVLLGEIATRCPKLNELRLETCAPSLSLSGTTVFVSLTNLQLVDCSRLQSNAGVKNVARCCPKLTTLRIFAKSPSQTCITRDGLIRLADSCPNLAVLLLSSCYDITGADLETFAKKYPSIRNITLMGSKLPALRDSIQLLLTVPTLSLTKITDHQALNHEELANITDRIYAMLAQETIQQVVERYCACAMLGLYEDTLFVPFITRLQHEHPGLVERAKISWASQKLGTYEEHALPPGLNGEEKTVFEAVKKELDDQDRPENRQASREKAAPLVMEMLELFPKN